MWPLPQFGGGICHAIVPAVLPYLIYPCNVRAHRSVLTQMVALTLTSPQPKMHLMGFLVFMSGAYVSFFIQFIIAVGYLMTDRVLVFIALTLFLAFG